MRNCILKNSLIALIVILFLCSTFASGINGLSKVTNQVYSDVENEYKSQKKVVISCQTYGIPGKKPKLFELPEYDARELLEKINELAIETSIDPLSAETEQLQQEIMKTAKEYEIISKDTSLEDLRPRFAKSSNPRKGVSPVNGNKGTAVLCNFATAGEGSQFPIIILPRLIPIIQLPVPRIFLHWSSPDGITSCGSYLTNTGFIAGGEQTGIALGFWGIGFSIFLPPIQAYGFFGYALYSRCTAEFMEPWPPNNAPIISNEKPVNGEWGISVSTNELSFTIEDPDGDKMDYKVTTDPDIGSGNGKNKNDGTYTVPISNLEHTTSYTWTLEVTDSVNTVNSEFSFITEELPFDPFEEGWQYRKKITIDHTKIDGNLENFPVLVDTIDTDLRDKAQDDGDDIIFMDGIGVANKMYHELEDYDSDSGEMIAWVNVGEISASKDTDFYMYYGNPSCDNQQFPELVWDPHYCGVWHLNDFKDSTFNKNHGVNHGTDSCSGKIDIARDFVEVNEDYISLGDMPEPGDGSITKGTYEVWINPKEIEGRMIICKLDTKLEPDRKSYALGFKDTGQLHFSAYSGTWYTDGRFIRSITNEGHITIDNWQHIVVVVDLSDEDIVIYYNGEEISSNVTTTGSPPSHFYNINLDERLGKSSPESSGPYFYNGSMDEVRISKICRSSEWISTEYNNQNNPDTFLSFGPEET